MSLFGKEGYSYHGSVRKYTVLFGTLFSDMMLKRGETWIKVPLRFGVGNLYEKMPQGVADRDVTRVREIFPAMSFHITDIQRDSTRQTNPHHMIDMASGQVVQYRVPQNIQFELTLRNKNIEDHLQMLEQVTTAFNPTYTAKINPIDGIDRSENVVITLDSFTVEDNSDTQVTDDERTIEATMVFTVKGYFYKAAKPADIVTEVVYGTGTDEYDLNQSVFVYDRDTETVLMNHSELSALIESGLVETRIVNPENVSKTKRTPKRRSKLNN